MKVRKPEGKGNAEMNKKDMKRDDRRNTKGDVKKKMKTGRKEK